MRSLALTALIAASAPAYAQGDLFALFGTGAETKAAAGAGQVASRGAPATFYNPANLIESPKGVEPYFGLDVVSLSYAYEYPGFDPVAIERIVPIPFLGLAYRPEGLDKLVIGGSFLPIPGSSGEQEIKKLPIRLVSTEPMLVDVASKGGDELGYRGSLGAAFKVMSGLTVGAAVQLSAGSGSVEAKNSETQETVLRESSKSSTQATVFGIRGNALKGRVAGVFTFRPGSTTKVTSRTELPTLGPEAVLDQSKTVDGPMAYGAGVEGRVWKGLSPFVEVYFEKWGALRSQERSSGIDEAEADYFDTTDIMLGASYTDGPDKILGGYGIFQSHIGQGILASESADEKGLIGQEFRDIDGLPYDVWSVGYSGRFPRAQITTALSYTKGRREVWNKAKGYGSYELSLIAFTLGWAHRL